MITYREYCKTIKEDWGKTSPIPKEVYDFPDPLKGINWVDLGLPSGTLWADANVKKESDGSPYWMYDEIMDSEYAEFVPTKEQLKELYTCCHWDWDDVNKGCIVTGKKNGNSIFLPAEGFRRYDNSEDVEDVGNYGYYWSSTRINGDSAFRLVFNPVGAAPNLLNHCYGGRSVRLVRNKN